MADLFEAVVGKGERGGADDAGPDGQPAGAAREREERRVPDELENDVDQLVRQERVEVGGPERRVDQSVEEESVVVAERVGVRKEVGRPVPDRSAGEGRAPMLEDADADDGIVLVAEQQREAV